VLELLQKYGKATRKDVNDLLVPKLPDVLDDKQKADKVRNLLQAMRQAGQIENHGTRNAPIWRHRPPS